MKYVIKVSLFYEQKVKFWILNNVAIVKKILVIYVVEFFKKTFN